MSDRSITDDRQWDDLRRQWRLRDDTIYLNHGSFGPPPEPVRAARRRWIDELDRQPMDFFVRRCSSALQSSRERLASLVGVDAGDLVFVENSTAAMNVLADSFPLGSDDEVLLTDHEYGAVIRIWQRACRRAGARPPSIAQLPLPVDSKEEIVEALFARASEKTRLIIISHITSATAIILPVAEICERARRHNIRVCVDGPHAVAQLPLNLHDLECDYYTASCHKWLSAPFGSGFLYAAPDVQHLIRPQRLSWGVLPPDQPSRWDEEFFWSGTRDPSSQLAVADAIEFLEQVGLRAFRERTHHLARYARERISQLPEAAVITPDDPDWFGSMSLVRLADGDNVQLQQSLWSRHGIETPIVSFNGRRYVRVSCHLYNTHRDVDALADALRKELV